MKLLLPPHHSHDDACIWRAAIARGFQTFRGQRPEEYEGPADAYYGNVLHRDLIRPYAGITCELLDPRWVSDPWIEQHGAFQRNIVAVQYKDLYQRFPTDHVAFVKLCAEKWFKPFIGRLDAIPAEVVRPEDWLHVQEPIGIRDEVRCFCLDGKILTASYYRKNQMSWAGAGTRNPHPLWSELVEYVAPALPRGVVIDLGWRANTNEWVVIEANEAWASGIYDCSASECLDVILASQSGAMTPRSRHAVANAFFGPADPPPPAPDAPASG